MGRALTLWGICFFLLAPAAGVFSQTAFSQTATPWSSAGLQRGIQLYGEGKWQEAVIELRRVQAEASTGGQEAEVLYWISLAELSAGAYDASLADMEALERIAAGGRIGELPYHKGRVLYYLGRYDEAIVLLKSYADGVGEGHDSRKSASLYWIGECLFSLGQLDKAGEVFTIITEEYPQSVKFEAASYRLALIKQKKIEAELLALLTWSHEESLKTTEEYRRRERTYDQALIAYQKRIAELLRNGRASDPGLSESDRLREAEEQIRVLQEDLNTAREQVAPLPVPLSDEEKSSRLRELKTQAQKLNDDLSTLYQEGLNK
ncbi:MAG: tetratricopeptide repeat protein [Treponema sp.]|jgi:tetratricopeptide (TPR) repeat protein|nr:tetratricopeptide repeat protein [Treponema sp.]